MAGRGSLIWQKFSRKMLYDADWQAKRLQQMHRDGGGSTCPRAAPHRRKRRSHRRNRRLSRYSLSGGPHDRWNRSPCSGPAESAWPFSSYDRPGVDAFERPLPRSPTGCVACDSEAARTPHPAGFPSNKLTDETVHLAASFRAARTKEREEAQEVVPFRQSMDA